MNIPKSGISADGVKNMMFGAGVLFKNFKYGEHFIPTSDTVCKSGKTYYYKTGGPSGGVNYTELEGSDFNSGTIYYEKYTGFGGDKIGATQDGVNITLTPEYTNIDVDGVLVKMKGLTVKTGEVATIEANVVSLTYETLGMAINGDISMAAGSELTGATGMAIVNSKGNINSGDYINNLAVAIPKLDEGKLVCIVFKNALCTSGISLATKNKSVVANKYTFECIADVSDQNVSVLPYEIIIMPISA